MDLLTHISAGIAVGTTAAIFAKKYTFAKKLGIIFAGALGGALPDIDAISLWAKFDIIFGKTLGLQHSGKDIYSSKFWYSHHGFMHSLLASLLIAFIIFVTAYFINQKFKNINWLTFRKSLYNARFFIYSFTGAYIAHLFCDMLTPGGPWGGINLFYPLKIYTGGWGKIWWWNNYDIFLIFNVFNIINIVIILLSSFIKAKLHYLSLTLLITALLFVCIQANNRKINYNYKGAKAYQEMESQSKEVQKKILGEKWYKRMKKLDNSIPLHF